MIAKKCFPNSVIKAVCASWQQHLLKRIKQPDEQHQTFVSFPNSNSVFETKGLSTKELHIVKITLQNLYMEESVLT